MGSGVQLSSVTCPLKSLLFSLQSNQLSQADNCNVPESECCGEAEEEGASRRVYYHGHPQAWVIYILVLSQG